MKRNLITLTQNEYDVLVVGGGIYGAWMALEAVTRGLSVALVEKGDFCSATSANSLKTIHGGLRYLQHADFKRMRESIAERTTLLRVAPHLIHPLPVIIPTYGHAMKGREIMALALAMNDVISADRNRLADPQKHIPRGYTISASECLRRLPGIPEARLTGGAVFYDAQAYNSERLVIEVLRSAVEQGAHAANYLEVTGFIRQGDIIAGVEARDNLTGDRLAIRSRLVINTAGPWVNRVLGMLNAASLPAIQLGQSVNLVTRRLFEQYAVGLSAPRTYRDSDAIINKGSRLLFFAPWRDCTIIGTTADPYHDSPDSFSITPDYVQRFLDDINQAYPPARLSLDDVKLVHAGLLPAAGVDPNSGDARIAKHYRIHDHRQDGINGLMTVVGVKYTTARHIAEETINRVFRRDGRQSPHSTSAVRPVHGGSIERFEPFLRGEVHKKPCGLDEAAVQRLVYNYGSAYGEVLSAFDGELAQQRGTEYAVLKAETLHAVRDEMACTLADVLLRRSDWASAGHPGADIVRFCAEVMAAELGWTAEHTRQQLETFQTHFPSGQGAHAQLAGTTV